MHERMKRVWIFLIAAVSDMGLSSFNCGGNWALVAAQVPIALIAFNFGLSHMAQSRKVLHVFFFIFLLKLCSFALQLVPVEIYYVNPVLYALPLRNMLRGNYFLLISSILHAHSSRFNVRVFRCSRRGVKLLLRANYPRRRSDGGAYD